MQQLQQLLLLQFLLLSLLLLLLHALQQQHLAVYPYSQMPQQQSVETKAK